MTRAVAFAAGLLLSVSTSVAAPTTHAALVRDLQVGRDPGASSHIGWLTPFRGELYFAADDGFLGQELWATGGSAAQTRLVADLCAGRCAGMPTYLTVSGDLLYFFARDRRGEQWLWRTDGSDGGTLPLVDVHRDQNSVSRPDTYLAAFAGGVVFVNEDVARLGESLWFSDGSRVGTHRIAELPSSGFPFDFPHGDDGPGRHYFGWQFGLWVTDGTAAGTHPLHLGVTWCGGFYRASFGLVIGGADAAHGCEPWVWDGHRARLLRELVPGPGEGSFGHLVDVGGRAYFVARSDTGNDPPWVLWTTDGSFAGTRPVRFANGRAAVRAAILGTVGERLFFQCDDGAHGTELCATDAAGRAVLVADLSPGATGSDLSNGCDAGGRMTFAARSGGELALWTTDGSTTGTRRLRAIGESAGSFESVAFRHRPFFVVDFADGAGEELASSDGTVDGTREVLDLAAPARSSDPAHLVAASHGLVFLATSEGWLDPTAWRTSGWRGETRQLTLEATGGALSRGLVATAGAGGAFLDEAWDARLSWSDGNTVRTVLEDPSVGFPSAFVDVVGSSPASSLFVAEQTGADGGAALWAWSSDGSPAGTSQRALLDDGGLPPASYRFAATASASGGMDVLAQRTQGSFVTSATPVIAIDGGGTRRVLAGVPGAQRTTVRALASSGGTTFVALSDGAAQLWAARAGETVARKVAQASRSGAFVEFQELTPLRSRVFFVGDDREHGRELWSSDGSSAGTNVLLDLLPGQESSAPSDLLVLGDRLLFAADDGAHGRELWVSDGTAAGTHMLELRPGVRGSEPQALRAIGSVVVFSADDGVHGLEPWVSDGTLAGTRLLADVAPGPTSSSAREFTALGPWLLFNAGRPDTGYELYRVARAALGGSGGGPPAK